MSAKGFELFVAPHEVVCRSAAEDRLEQLRSEPTVRYLRFPKSFAPSHILQLGEAVSVITGVLEDFGNDRDREEPREMVFVDKLTPEWVKATSKLSSHNSLRIEKLWIDAYITEEGERPSWANEPRKELIDQFLKLCAVAASAETDLVMVWRL